MQEATARGMWSNHSQGIWILKIICGTILFFFLSIYKDFTVKAETERIRGEECDAWGFQLYLIPKTSRVQKVNMWCGSSVACKMSVNIFFLPHKSFIINSNWNVVTDSARRPVKPCHHCTCSSTLVVWHDYQQTQDYRTSFVSQLPLHTDVLIV